MLENKIYWRTLPEAWHLSSEAQNRLSHADIDIIENAYEYITDEFEFDRLLERLVLTQNTGMVKRIIKWIDMFVNCRGYENPAYSTLLIATLLLFDTQKLIHLQTQHQFEVSRSFVKIVLLEKVNLGHNEAISILIIILILSVRPDFCVRSFKKGLTGFDGAYYSNTLELSPFKFFKHVFIDKEKPIFLGRHIDECSAEELNILIHILGGDSLRKFAPKRLKISKSENTLLQQNLITIDMVQSNYLERYVLAARILKEAPTETHILSRILNSSKVFRDELTSFGNDIRFWQSVFRLLVRAKETILQFRDIAHSVDFFEYHRYYVDEPLKYSLKGRTIESVNNAIMDWNNGGFKFQTKYLTTKWEGLSIPKWQIIIDNKMYAIEEINFGKRLKIESEVLRHCIFSYLNSCVNGSTHVFSLGEIIKKKHKPHITIEVNNGKVTETAGKFNREPNEAELKIINMWAKENGLIFQIDYSH